MAARPRDRVRRDWPTGLREPRPGYYSWRNPATGVEMGLGRMPLAQAKQQVNAALDYLQAQQPTLLERLSGEANTIAQLLDKMPTPPNLNTAKSWRSLDKKIRTALGAYTCQGLTTMHCAELLEAEVEAGRERTAEALRSRLVAVCKRGMALGWITGANPAEPTETVAVTVKRGRLSLEMFNAILTKAPEVATWLRGAMLVALVSGQPREVISAARRPSRGPDFWTVERGKTGVIIEIPLALRLDAIGITLAQALEACDSGVRSLAAGRDFIVHHAREFGNAPLGSAVHPNNLSRSFTEARQLAGIPDVLPDGKLAPTFHEIRSLAKRLYGKQGGVDTKALLGHLTDKMGDLYENPRGSEPIRVRLGG
jgi:enterobacteria phage integrase